MASLTFFLNGSSSGRRNAHKLVREADIARDSGDYASAAALYTRSLALYRTAPIHVQCGHMLKELGRMDEALAQYSAALTLTPDDPDLNLQVGHLYKVWGRWPEAIAAYERASELGLPAPVELRFVRLREALHVVRSLLLDNFDTSRYLARNPEVAAAGMNPLEHFMCYGVHQGRSVEHGRVEIQLTKELWLEGVPNR